MSALGQKRTFYEALAVLSGHGGWVNSAAFSPDGTRILTTSHDETARVWRAFPTTQTLVDHGTTIAPRCLTQGQRKAFFLEPEPPRWCITGIGHESEKDPAIWEGKWPNHTKLWKEWLAAKDRGDNIPLPGTEER